MSIDHELQELLGPTKVLAGKENLSFYGSDWTRSFKPAPSAIVLPTCIEHLVKLVHWAADKRVALVPSGGRTGLSGGAVAAAGEVVVSFSKMNRILELNKIDRILTVEAGVITQNVQELAAASKLFFPIDFASRGSSQIGGNVATNAGGIKVVRYGLIRNWIAGMRVVTGKGDVLHLNNGLTKNATGYDLRHLFIGSEGTLGFIAEVDLVLTDPPKGLQILFISTSSLTAVVQMFSIFRNSVSVHAFEFFSRNVLPYVLESTNCRMPFGSSEPYFVLVEVENPNDNYSEALAAAFDECTRQGLISDSVLAIDSLERKNIWLLRESITESISAHMPYKNDVAIKISKIPNFVQDAEVAISEVYPSFVVVWFGHIGDGNLHINILKPPGMPPDQFASYCADANKKLYQVVEFYNGSISAEHGVGLVKKPFLHYTRTAEEISYLRSIKDLFDPYQIMNPGKIFDKVTGDPYA